MKCIPIKTKRFEAPQDNLFSELDRVLDGVIKEGDVLVVTSKVVSLHEGRTIPLNEVEDKDVLVRNESDAYLETSGMWNLSIRDSALLLSAGVDESNVNDHYVLLPKDSFESAKRIRDYVMRKWNLKNLGVIVTDSHSIPFRYGTLGVSLGFSGLKPVCHFTGERDLFGREFKCTRINVVDALAGMAVFMMGETDEQTPLCIVRSAPHVEFSEEAHKEELCIPPQEDIYYELLKPFYE